MSALTLARGRCAACRCDAQLAPQTVVLPTPDVRWVCANLPGCLRRRGLIR